MNNNFSLFFSLDHQINTPKLPHLQGKNNQPNQNMNKSIKKR